MTPTDEILKTPESSIFQPYQHQDYYGLDSLFLSPLKTNEKWNLQNVTSVSPSLLAFLTLRSYLSKSLLEQNLEVSGLNKVWKSYLARTMYFRKNTKVFTTDFVPELVNSENQDLNQGHFISTGDWKDSLRWEFLEKGKKTLFYVAASKIENVSSKNLSELLSQFLVESQRTDRLLKAYIRKENSSYLYLQSEDQIHPRVFYKEDQTSFPEFLLFIAELIPV